MLSLMGVVRVSHAAQGHQDPQTAVEAAVSMAGGAGPRSCAVRARRRDKRFPVTSAELAGQSSGPGSSGQYGNPVSLKKPDINICLEVDPREVFVFIGGAGRAGCRSA